jgi:hypothetical protein
MAIQVEESILVGTITVMQAVVIIIQDMVDILVDIYVRKEFSEISRRNKKEGC